MSGGRGFATAGLHRLACYHGSPCTRCREKPDPQKTQFMANILIGVFAIFLCLINAAVWAFISNMPFVGLCWVAAAGACIWMQKWSRGM